MASRKVALVLGSHGTLGRTMVNLFKSRGWSVVGVDLIKNDDCDTSVVVPSAENWADRQRFVVEQIRTRISRFACF
jgi:NAD(P)-dependent dehydrogenase (short-subunit alcohol dehydrogenase family)